MSGPVLIGVSGTARDADAIALGRDLSEALGTEETVATVVAPAGSLRTGHETIDRALVDAGRAGSRVGRAVHQSSSPAGGLSELARGRGATALVVGAPHRGHLGRAFAGTVGIEALSQAPCPVAFAPAGYATREIRPLRRIGVGYDGTPEGESALEHAVALSKALGTRLRIISMVDPLQPVSLGYPHGDTAGIRRALSDAVRRKSAEAAVEGRLLHGTGARLTDVADVDAMVVGCHRRGRLARFLSGSVSAETVRTAPYPVVVIPFDRDRPARGVPSEPTLATL